MKIIDWYILKRYLVTFIAMLVLFAPIGIVIDISEKIGKILENKAPLGETVMFYLNFTVYFANFLFPIFLFLSIIWFTSKLANNSEIIAILSSGISFTRFLRPYLIGATLISILALFMSFYLVPNASKGYNEFRYKYLKKHHETRESNNVFKQLNDTQYIHVGNFNPSSKTGIEFTLETFDKNNKLKEKIQAASIRWNEQDSTYTLSAFKKRKVGELNDIIIAEPIKDTLLNFDLDDLTPVIYMAETLTISDLNKFIEKEKQRGSSNINSYLVVKYKKYSVPISAFILTIIAVSVSAMKRRGGMGLNLALGIFIAFSYVFFDKMFGTLAEKSSMSPLLAVWLPNILFGVLAIYLLKNAKR
jgi:lipopolysaccharide export system permease protein